MIFKLTIEVFKGAKSAGSCDWRLGHPDPCLLFVANRDKLLLFLGSLGGGASSIAAPPAAPSHPHLAHLHPTRVGHMEEGGDIPPQGSKTW